MVIYNHYLTPTRGSEPLYMKPLLKQVPDMNRTILTLGGGALALSITFLEKIAPSPHPSTVIILVIAWLALLLSVVMQLLALASSQKAVQLQIERLDSEYGYYRAADNLEEAVRTKPSEPENPHVKCVSTYNVISRWALIFGIILLFMFSGINVQPKGDKMSTEKKTTAKTNRETY